MQIAQSLVLLGLLLDALMVPSFDDSVLRICVIHEAIVVYFIAARGLQCSESKIDLATLVLRE